MIIPPGGFSDLIVNTVHGRIIRVISGIGLMSLDNCPVHLTTGKIIDIPDGSRYRIFNLDKNIPLDVTMDTKMIYQDFYMV